MAEKTTCSDVIKSCDKALEEKNNVIEKSDKAIEMLNKKNTELEVQVIEKEASLNAWYRNPLMVGLLGVVVGAITFTFLQK